MVTLQELTLEEFLQLPEEDVWLEYVDGEVVPKFVGAVQPAILRAELLARLQSDSRASGLEILPGTSFIFGTPTRVCVPDITSPAATR